MSDSYKKGASMTLEEIKSNYPGKRIVAMADSENGLTLYAGVVRIPWPSDWPESGINGEWIENQGVEILR